MNTEDLARSLRLNVVEMSYRARTAHLASALSIIDILVVLYSDVIDLKSGPIDISRDRFILSKGHAASALYAVLAWKGVIPKSELDAFGEKGSLLEEHPCPKLNGIEAATGSLGHGLPIGNGMALSALIKKIKYRVFVLMGDGECNEGSVWEGAMFAAQHKLNNLTAIVDFNKWQATGRIDKTLKFGTLSKKWESFGWNAIDIDGHNHKDLKKALQEFDGERPTVIIAHTTKGRGISFMEDNNNWHYRSPNEQELAMARAELGFV